MLTFANEVYRSLGESVIGVRMRCLFSIVTCRGDY
jgi:hypothetical protein